MKEETSNIVDRCMHLACDMFLTQMTERNGFKQYGAKAVDAMVKEFTQLNEGVVHGKPVLVPTNSNSLTTTEVNQKRAPK